MMASPLMAVGAAMLVPTSRKDALKVTSIVLFQIMF